MTIKEIEEKTGMTRANIRFYESEGLFTSARNKNGYREYSQEDLELLNKIKLLRRLHISLEEIKKLQTGEQELSTALERHLIRLESEKEDINRSAEVCRTMKNEGVHYATLDAQKYLNLFGQAPEKEKYQFPELSADSLPKEYAYWRRFFARNLDFSIYSVLLDIILLKVFDYNILQESAWMDIFSTVVVLLIMYLVEPVLLSVFGTTIGKWVLGIRVTDNNEMRLSYSEARARTLSVLWNGMAFNIPILSLVFLYRRYKECKEGKTLEWEYNSSIYVKDRDMRLWRVFSYAGAYILLFFAFFMSLLQEWIPRNRGDITVAEFCENYNYFAELIGYADNEYLDENGKWVDKYDGTYTVYVGAADEKPEFVFYEEDGIMTGMSFEVNSVKGNIWGYSYQDEMILAIRSFMGADKKCGPFDDEMNDIIDWINENSFEDFSFTAHGVTVRCEAEAADLEETTLGIIWSGGEMGTIITGNYSFEFTMSKEQ